MSDRQLAAAGIRKGLELWPDASHWCRGRLTANAEDGTKQRCTHQMLADGMGLASDAVYFVGGPIMLARDEILRVAKARGVRGTEWDSICGINNKNDFDTIKSIVEEAATNLEKTQ